MRLHFLQLLIATINLRCYLVSHSGFGLGGVTNVWSVFSVAFCALFHLVQKEGTNPIA